MNNECLIHPARLRCEYLENPLGIDVRIPRLSWIVQSTQRGQKQTAYRVLVASSSEILARDEGDLWDSGKVESDQTLHIEYAGLELTSQMQCFWKVCVWDIEGTPSLWSESALWTMGLLKAEDWAGAQWIDGGESCRANGVSPWLRKTMDFKIPPERAMAYVCSLYYYELYVNGKKVGDAELAPASSQMDSRACYNVYDISEYLTIGRNAIVLWLGSGTYRPWLPGITSASPKVMARFAWSCSDGTQGSIVTDSTWKAHPSPLCQTGLLSEVYDATQEIDGWSSPKYDDASWSSAGRVETPPVLVSAQKTQPNRVICTIRPQSVREVSPGVYEVDMGRNYVGYFQLRIQTARGDRIEMEFYEVELKSSQRQSYTQCDVYIAKGVPGEMFCHRLDYRAFRYVTIRGVKQAPTLDDACCLMISADIGSTATFECSNDLVNRIHETVDWTYRCVNLNGRIVDCPHRERLGYGAEGQTTMLTAMTHSDAPAMFTHWLQTWRDLQNSSTGMMTNTGPRADSLEGSPGWGGICVTLPWELFLRYNDKRILEESYPAIRRWLDFLRSKMRDDLLQHYGDDEIGFLADWVAPGRQLLGRWTNAVPKECDIFFNNCYFIHILELASCIAEILGRDDEAQQYVEQASRQRVATHAAFYNLDREGYVNGEQAYQAMALLTGVIPAERRAKLSTLLDMLISEAGKGHLNTGVLGTFFLFCHLLHENRNDLIYQMVNQRTYPSWGWLLEKGATTIGEQWGGGASQIHSSFLCVNSWCIEGIGGIQPALDLPGYKHIVIRPGVVGDLTWANARYDSIRGRISCDWRIENEHLLMDVEIPANTFATVYVPVQDNEAVYEGDTPAGEAEGVTFVRNENDAAVFTVDSGRYHFRTKCVRSSGE